ncbi:adenosine deaminase [Streptomyces sp. TG1A-8]|uniref:adenosine deaminase n=1 Tax=Streptomyces sp. TG1A-8 TaxID=3051385 RepID=UPI00265C1EF6|nr:adenosine deaminase [Streptomyces sp. TG1A-8]MDO0929517.1 adenosine deaminase [Streptomyces sp. TG1A-8]
MPLWQFCRGLPKAELHVHLEGCLEPDFLLELARRNEVAVPWETAEQLREAYRFRDLGSFLDLYFAGCQVLCDQRDFYELTTAYLDRAHQDGVAHAELFFGPQTFIERGIPVGVQLEGILDAVADAGARTGISASLLVSAHRHRTDDDAFALLDSVGPWADRIAGFGMGGAEVGNPPEKFVRYFAELRRQGFKTCVHAGEEGPADYVRQAVELLGVDRVDHGITILDDEDLVREVAAAGTPLTVCPISNVRLRTVPSLSEHPLPRMLAAGLNVSLHSDDPAYFGSGLADTYTATAEGVGLDRGTLTELARNSVRASFLPHASRQALLSRIDAVAPADC